MKAFSKLHPMVLLCYFVSILAIAMFSGNPVMELTSLIGGTLFCLTLTPRREKRSDLMFYLPLFLLITITNPLFSHNGKTPLFFMNGNAVTLEAFVYGAAVAVMLISVLLWCKSYSYVMTSDKFIYLFGRIIPQLSLVVSMALRYVPMLKRQARKVSRAQKAMGLYTSDSLFDRIRASMRVASVLIGWSLEHAVETGKSMKARGYGLKGRTHYSDYRFCPGDAVMLCVTVLLASGTAAGMAAGYTDFYYYPGISELNLSPVSVLIYAGFAVLSLLPFFMEVEENIRWNCYRSKI
ncbi:MAG: energy-coupling factor transporter transmembrane protein EcfT [Clostridiales bacterium]|nr:energy-coupling factor transporter transmembrane protein EcfT [Clostridiales bacterium]